ncbi:hypothetical protein CspeluHIS016_0902750 [Cutaneotrichosporon spelunceum]|uniref:Uncharacterized protein n=1 Tax=Cutaneotrichosporon spelunceum TaxID=1672016 RepID=A0AAD3U022_9TREE|nr:hypothetical protein CspeluHIS016_0902750 [Cutaneotrichosporon spelunceum]
MLRNTSLVRSASVCLAAAPTLQAPPLERTFPIVVARLSSSDPAAKTTLARYQPTTSIVVTGQASLSSPPSIPEGDHESLSFHSRQVSSLVLIEMARRLAEAEGIANFFPKHLAEKNEVLIKAEAKASATSLFIGSQGCQEWQVENEALKDQLEPAEGPVAAQFRDMYTASSAACSRWASAQLKYKEALPKQALSTLDSTQVTLAERTDQLATTTLELRSDTLHMTKEALRTTKSAVKHTRAELAHVDSQLGDSLANLTLKTQECSYYADQVTGRTQAQQSLLCQNDYLRLRRSRMESSGGEAAVEHAADNGGSRTDAMACDESSNGNSQFAHNLSNDQLASAYPTGCHCDLPLRRRRRRTSNAHGQCSGRPRAVEAS